MTVFVAVAERQSFAAAGRALDLAPPVVTRTIAALEQHLGAPLLLRTTRQVTLTEAGESYLEECRRILAQIAEAEAAVAGVQGEARGLVSLTASVLFGQLYAAPVVRRLLDAHPALRARLILVDRVVNLVDEGIDVAVRLGELPDSTLRAARVGFVRKVVVAAPAYLAREGIPQTPQELALRPVAAASGVPIATDWRGEEGRSARLELTPRLQTTTIQTALDAALAGWGLARVLSYTAASHVLAGRLRIVLEAHEPPPAPIHVLHAHGGRPAAKVRLLFDALVAALRADKSLNTPL